MATSTSPTHALAGPALDNRRMAAGAIDLAAPVVAALALYLADLLTPMTALVLVGWSLFYFFALESGGGQTLGKRAMHLRVVSADGGDPTMQQYATRTIARVVDTPAIGLVAMLVTGDRRQRLGDMAARTSVVGAEAPAAQMDAFDAAHAHSKAMAKPAAPAEPKPKRSRPSLGGPELKMPSLRRSKGPKSPNPAKQPKAAKAPKPSRQGRPTLGGPEIKLPSFGRRKQKPVASPSAPEPEAVPAPEPAAAEPPPVPEVKPFDPFSEDAPEPSVEVVSHGDPGPPPEPAPAVEPPAPAPAPPAMPAPPPAAERPTIPAIEPQPAAAEPKPEPQPTTAHQLKPEHVEGVRDDGSSRVNVKPIETVSAMDLLMREAEEQDRQSR